MRIFTKYFVFNLGRRVEGWREIPYFYKTKYLCEKFELPSTTSTFGKVPDATHQNIGVVGKVPSMLHAVVKLPARMS